MAVGPDLNKQRKQMARAREQRNDVRLVSAPVAGGLWSALAAVQ